MQGIVKGINNRKGFIAVETDSGEYAVLELLGGYDVEIGDVISGPLESLGEEEVINLTQSEEMDVFIQEIYCNLQSAQSLMR